MTMAWVPSGLSANPAASADVKTFQTCVGKIDGSKKYIAGMVNSTGPRQCPVPSPDVLGKQAFNLLNDSAVALGDSNRPLNSMKPLLASQEKEDLQNLKKKFLKLKKIHANVNAVSQDALAGNRIPKFNSWVANTKNLQQTAEDLNQTIDSVNAQCALLQSKKAAKIPAATKAKMAAATLGALYTNPSVVQLGTTEYFQKWVMYETPTLQSAIDRCLSKGVGIKKNPLAESMYAKANPYSTLGKEAGLKAVQNYGLNENDLKSAIGEAKEALADGKKDLDRTKKEVNALVPTDRASLQNAITKIEEELAHAVATYPAAVSRVVTRDTKAPGVDWSGLSGYDTSTLLCGAATRAVGSAKWEETKNDLLNYAEMGAMGVAMLIPGVNAAAIAGAGTLFAVGKSGTAIYDTMANSDEVRAGMVAGLLPPESAMAKLSENEKKIFQESTAIAMAAFGVASGTVMKAETKIASAAESQISSGVAKNVVAKAEAKAASSASSKGAGVGLTPDKNASVLDYSAAFKDPARDSAVAELRTSLKKAGHGEIPDSVLQKMEEAHRLETLSKLKVDPKTGKPLVAYDKRKAIVAVEKDLAQYVGPAEAKRLTRELADKNVLGVTQNLTKAEATAVDDFLLGASRRTTSTSPSKGSTILLEENGRKSTARIEGFMTDPKTGEQKMSIVHPDGSAETLIKPAQVKKLDVRWSWQEDFTAELKRKTNGQVDAAGRPLGQNALRTGEGSIAYRGDTLKIDGDLYKLESQHGDKIVVTPIRTHGGTTYDATSETISAAEIRSLSLIKRSGRQADAKAKYGKAGVGNYSEEYTKPLAKVETGPNPWAAKTTSERKLAADKAKRETAKEETVADHAKPAGVAESSKPKEAPPQPSSAQATPAEVAREERAARIAANEKADAQRLADEAATKKANAETLAAEKKAPDSASAESYEDRVERFEKFGLNPTQVSRITDDAPAGVSQTAADEFRKELIPFWKSKATVKLEEPVPFEMLRVGDGKPMNGFLLGGDQNNTYTITQTPKGDWIHNTIPNSDFRKQLAGAVKAPTRIDVSNPTYTKALEDARKRNPLLK